MSEADDTVNLNRADIDEEIRKSLNDFTYHNMVEAYRAGYARAVQTYADEYVDLEESTLYADSYMRFRDLKKILVPSMVIFAHMAYRPGHWDEGVDRFTYRGPVLVGHDPDRKLFLLPITGERVNIDDDTLFLNIEYVIWDPEENSRASEKSNPHPPLVGMAGQYGYRKTQAPTTSGLTNVRMEPLPEF